MATTSTSNTTTETSTTPTSTSTKTTTTNETTTVTVKASNDSSSIEVKAHFNSEHEEEKKEYDKDTGSSKGKFSVNAAKHRDNMMAQVNSMKKNSMLAGLSDQKALLGADIGADLKLSDKLLGGLKKLQSVTSLSTNSLLANAGLGSLGSALANVEKLGGSLLQGLLGALLSQLHMPDAVYVASIIAMDTAGADLEMNNNYIRKLIIKRDITLGVMWWNKVWEISYSGFRSDRNTADVIESAKSGAIKNVKWMLDQMYDQYKTIKNDAGQDPNESESRRLLSKADEIYNTILYSVKLAIVYSYSNLTTAELADFLSSYKIKPSVFGIGDKEYGGRYAIRGADLNIISPFYKPYKKTEYKDVTDPVTGKVTKVPFEVGGLNFLEDQTNSLITTRSSKLRRAQKNKEVKPAKPFDFGKLFIDPQNKNVKRLYLLLSDSSIHGSNIMYNPELAERLQYRIISTFGRALDSVMGDLKSFIPEDFLKTRESIWTSAYDFTKLVEDVLYDPAKVEYIRLIDTTIIRAPDELPSALLNSVAKTPGSGESTGSTSKDNITADTAKDVISTSIISQGIINDYYKEIVNYVNTYPEYDALKVYNTGDVVRHNSYLYKSLIDNNTSIPTTTSAWKLEVLVIIPSTYEELKDKLFEDFMKMDVEYYLNLVLTKITNGDLIITSKETIENIIYNMYKQDITVNVVPDTALNMDQIMAYILSKIADGTITATDLKGTSLNTIIYNTYQTLVQTNQYNTVINDYKQININNFMLDGLKNDVIGKIISGEISIDDIISGKITVDGLKVDSILKIENGETITTGINTTTIYKITIINNNLESLVNVNGIVDISTLLGGKSLKEFNDSILTSMKLYKDDMLTAFKKELALITETYFNMLKDGTISKNDFPTLDKLLELAIKNINKKEDILEAIEILKGQGIDNIFDSVEYIKILQEKLNKNAEGFFEFDINNPGKEIKDSIKQEIKDINSGLVPFMWYRWKPPTTTS